VEDAAVKQIAAIQSQEREKLDEVKNGEAAQIEEITKAANEKKALLELDKSSLGESVYNERVEAVRREERAKINEIKRSSREREALIKKEAERQVKTVRDAEKKQLEEIKKGSRSKLNEIKEFGEQANRSLSKLGSFLATGGLSVLGLGAAAAGIRQAVSALGEWGQEALRQEAVTDRLNAVLKSTGANAWVSSTLLQKMANEQRTATGKSREEIMEMQAVLLGFRSVTRDVFGDATQAILDMSAVMGGGLVSTANTLGKALDSPLVGMGALSRQGFVFTEQQKELIKVLEETGRHEEAQRVILKEVQMAFGGASTAASEAVRSQMRYNTALEDLKKNIGMGWQEATAPARNWLTEIITKYNEAIAKRNELDALGKNITTNFSEVLGENESASRNFINSLKAEYLEAFQSIENFAMAAENTEERQKRIQQELLRLYRQINEEKGYELSFIAEIAGAYGNFIPQVKEASREIQKEREAADAIRRFELERAEFIKNADAQAKAAQAEELAAQKTIAGKREQSRKALEQEIVLITKKARLEGKNIQSEEIQKQILNARVNAYTALIKEIGDAGEEEKRVFAELRAEYARLEIDAAARLQEDNLKNLERQKQAVLEKAELEGRAAGSLEVQKELLDAEVQAYGKQLEILRELIDGTGEEESERRRALQASWDQYRAEQMTAETQKKRLEEMIKLQEELRKKVSDMYGEAQQSIVSFEYTVNLNRLIEARKEVEKQGLEVAREAINTEAEYRIQAAKQVRDKEIAEFNVAIFNETDPEKIAQMEKQVLIIKRDANIKYVEEVKKIYADLMKEQSGWGAQDRIEAIANQEIETLRKINEERKREMRESAGDDVVARASANNQIEALDRDLADREVEIHRAANEEIKRANAALMSSLASNMQSYLDSFSQAMNSMFSIWNSAIDAELEAKLRENDQIIQSDEERAKREKELLKEAAQMRYEAEIVQWAANILTAHAQAALGVLSQMSGDPYSMVPRMVMAGILGGLQVAAVIAARPQPPRFHQGGMVRGASGQEVPAVLKAGEIVLTPSQFQNTMAAIAQLSRGNGGNGVSLSVDVKNYASRAVIEKPVFDRGVLHMIIRDEVNNMYGSGELNRGIAQKESRDRGIILE
ncbi:MAG: hypothetical protein LBH35_05085, partial [Treponema sp.]|jgi:hypothetical protein|nr:hypothetical protein [Treponema sp.]